MVFIKKMCATESDIKVGEWGITLWPNLHENGFVGNGELLTSHNHLKDNQGQ